ncbi:3,4-dihydroxy-2-butanone-4-phosphate synthase [Nocardia sp. CA2R105]|uniref:3,4-dihydroxy-2-butanone-4-phosphate synthase n=1 Tax=Nocardia coffeae TaxID=2873381 RepID=UPI001CA797E2|nr:3,4-dihydroxy-2-butanone-4-phosphate synthase [Nocardia coffeae]MBY8860376.1 3,4-dihydroxy-2-butanone-4-phosphate synthase [Nocardia coffeae]
MPATHRTSSRASCCPSTADSLRFGSSQPIRWREVSSLQLINVNVDVDNRVCFCEAHHIEAKECVVMNSPIMRVDNALADLGAGRPVVLVGSAPESDSYLLLAAEKTTVATMSFLIRYGSGLVCAALPGDECDRLGLVAMVGADSGCTATEYTVSVDAIDGITTGISAADRARTMRELASPASEPSAFSRPGHVVPTRARAMGVFGIQGPSEAAVDLARCAGLRPAGAFAALVSPVDSTRIATIIESVAFASEHALNWVSVHDVVVYRRSVESHVRVAEPVLRDGPYGSHQTITAHSDVTGIGYVVFRFGAPGPQAALVSLEQGPNPALYASGVDPRLDAAFRHAAESGNSVVIVRCAERGNDDDDVAADVAEILRMSNVSTLSPVGPVTQLAATLRHFGITVAADAVNPSSEPPAHGALQVVGDVVRGDQRGREMGFPTANLELDEELSGSVGKAVVDGVWAGRAALPDGRTVVAAISVGRRSTFYGRSGIRLLEAHLLDFEGDLYGLTLTVHLDQWIRPQTAFSSKEELVAAVAEDIAKTRVFAEGSRVRRSAHGREPHCGP